MVNVTYSFKNFSLREKILLGLDNIIDMGIIAKSKFLFLPSVNLHGRIQQNPKWITLFCFY